MPWTQTWIINGGPTVVAPIGEEHIRAVKYAPYSLAFFCPKCGEVWARRIITPATRWNVLTRECRSHKAPNYCEPGGSVWIGYDQDYTDHLPKEVLQYEALVQLDHAIKVNNERTSSHP